MSRYRYTSAFTLLEMLVVLVIVGMLSLVLMQVFSQGLVIRSRMSDRIQGMHVDQVKEQWFRRTVFALQRLKKEDERVFKGDAEKFSSVTLMAMDAAPGELRVVSFRVEVDGEDGKLIYSSEKGAEWPLFTWQSGTAKFSYLDAEGKWHTSWPVRAHDQRQQLPQGVLLSGHSREGSFSWYASIAGEKAANNPPPEDYRYGE